MANHKTYHAGKLSNWVLIATFILSVFLFSGYVNNTETQPKTTQTEFVSSYKPQKVRRALSLTKVCTSVYLNTPLSIRGYQTPFLIAFNRLTKIKFDQNKKQCVAFKPIEQFRSIKTIPQSKNEDIASTLLG
jgi:hypothetical protein